MRSTSRHTQHERAGDVGPERGPREPAGRHGDPGGQLVTGGGSAHGAQRDGDQHPRIGPTAGARTAPKRRRDRAPRRGRGRRAGRSSRRQPHQPRQASTAGDPCRDRVVGSSSTHWFGVASVASAHRAICRGPACGCPQRDGIGGTRRDGSQRDPAAWPVSGDPGRPLWASLRSEVTRRRVVAPRHPPEHAIVAKPAIVARERHTAAVVGTQ